MIKKINFVLLLVLFFLGSSAQKPDELLNQWSARSPIEKIYLHFDRENYIAGETAWFKAYLSSDYLPDTISTVLYVELVNQSSVVLNRIVAPILLSTTNGQIELPDSLSTGMYQIRAYTPTMLNHDASFIYKRGVFIYGKKNATVTSFKTTDNKINIEFFPEGGNMVAGFNNTIAFKATNEKGMPVAVNGKLWDSKNNELTNFSSYHDGMGMFDLTPSSNEKYVVTVNEDVTNKFSLPATVDKGIVLTVIPHPQGYYFEVQQRVGDPVFQAAYMIGQMQHHVVLKQNLKQDNSSAQGVIDTKKLPSGIMQITVFNKDGMPLAERLCFVNNREYIQAAELITDTLNFSAKAKNKFSVVMKDTVKGSFSIAVTDADYDISSERQENIFSGLLLTADIKGYVHNPAYYFSADNDSVKTALDLVMMINGWRRFKWNELGKTNTSVTYKDPSYITLAGKTTLLDSKKAFAEKQLLLFIMGADSVRTVQMINTDKQGNFKLDSMLLFGNKRLVFGDIRGKKSQYIEVHLSGDSVTRLYQLPMTEKRPFFLADNTLESKLAMDYDVIQKASGLMMQGITLKVKKKSPVQELEEKYASGLFAGFSEKTIDLMNTTEVITQANIFDYLQFRVAGLNIAKDGNDYYISYRQTGTVSMLGSLPMTIYLNEMETDASVISTIQASDIAMVKVYSSFVGAAGNGAGGALAIYTKKDADINTGGTSITDQVKFSGFSVIKEFYAPNYTVDPTIKDKTDQRITIDWRPTIFVNSIDSKIPFSFYNNDRTKKFKVVVEGMTNEGKLLMIEKIITPGNLKAF